MTASCPSVSCFANAMNQLQSNRKENNTRHPTTTGHATISRSFSQKRPFWKKMFVRLPVLVSPRWAVPSHATSLALALLWLSLSLSLSTLPLPPSFYKEMRQLKRCKKARKLNTNCRLCRRSSRLRRRSESRVRICRALTPFFHGKCAARSVILL